MQQCIAPLARGHNNSEMVIPGDILHRALIQLADSVRPIRGDELLRFL